MSPKWAFIDRTLATPQAGRRFRRTQRGRIGLLPELGESGDLVAVLTGGRVPIILKPQKDGYLTVVGDANVRGIMDGEAMPDVSDLEYRELR